MISVSYLNGIIICEISVQTVFHFMKFEIPEVPDTEIASWPASHYNQQWSTYVKDERGGCCADKALYKSLSLTMTFVVNWFVTVLAQAWELTQNERTDPLAPFLEESK